MQKVDQDEDSRARWIDDIKLVFIPTTTTTTSTTSTWRQSHSDSGGGREEWRRIEGVVRQSRTACRQNCHLEQVQNGSHRRH